MNEIISWSFKIGYLYTSLKGDIYNLMKSGKVYNCFNEKNTL